jgi:hypothetical protein
MEANVLLTELQGSDRGQTHWLLYLRQKLVSDIRHFNEQYLSVSAPSSFFTETVAIVARWITTNIQGTGNGDMADCLPAIRDHFIRFLSRACTELATLIASYLSNSKTISPSEARQLGVELSPSYGPSLDKNKFLVALHDKLTEAKRDASRWIALATSQDIPQAFRLLDVVELCLLNYHSGSNQEIIVSTTVSERRPGKGIVAFSEAPLIKGAYFELLETIIKNLISNAFAHSGLGLQTRLYFDLVHSVDHVVIRCRNTISPAKFRTLKAIVGHLEAEANKDIPAKAGEDIGSGLQKVRRAYKRSLDTIPTVTLSLKTRDAVAGTKTSDSLTPRDQASHPFMFQIVIEAKHPHGSVLSEKDSPG